MSSTTAVPTARQAIARVLRELGLEHGKDFTVHQLRHKTKVVGLKIFLMTERAEETAYVYVDVIRDNTRRLGFPFETNVYTTRSGQTLTDLWISL